MAPKSKTDKKPEKKSGYSLGGPVSALAYARSVEPSLGRMTASAVKDAPIAEHAPILVETQGFLGQISPFKDKKGNEGKNLPGFGQIARTPADKPWLHISASVRFIAQSRKPSMTDTAGVIEALAGVVNHAADTGVYRQIAGRYLWSILSGRFAWRNRLLADEQTVSVRIAGVNLLVNPLTLDLDVPFSTAADIATSTGASAEDLDAAISAIERGFLDPSAPAVAKIRWSGLVGTGATVYPSQAYPTASQKGKAKTAAGGDVGKILASIRIGNQDGCAVLTDQKIGAALRYFENWHGGAPVPVNPFAGNKETSEVLRPKSGKGPRHLYDLFLDGEFLGKPDAADPAELAFFIACLVRGGVYQTAETKENEKGEGAEGAEDNDA